jgi:hypothetical protein
MSHVYYSQRTGTNPHPEGLPLHDTIDLFTRMYMQLVEEGYLTEALGFECVDAGYVEGSIKDMVLEILLAVRKNDL